MFIALLQLLVLVGVPALVFLVYEQNARKRNAGPVEPPPVKPSTSSFPVTTTTTTTAAAAAAAGPAEPSASEAAKEKREGTVSPPLATRTTMVPPSPSSSSSSPAQPKILIAYASNSQNALTLSHKLFNAINKELLAQDEKRTAARGEADHKSAIASGHDGAAARPVTPAVKILELREEDSHACSVDTLLEANTASGNFYSLVVFVVSTFTDGAAPPRSANFEKVLKDCFEDHRVPRDALSSKRFALFGLGDIAYGETNFNAFGKHVVSYCRGMGAPHFVVPPVYATEAKVATLFQVFTQTLLKWLTRAEFMSDGTVRVQKRAAAATNKSAKGNSRAAGQGSCCKDAGEEEGEAKKGGSGSGSDDDEAEQSGLDEIEDLIDDIETNDEDHARAGGAAGGPKELLNPRLRKNLEKQGYNLIGSHSGVKLCRWTKAMLRGRGGCYKHTFYNINSSQCMELTPSLACANKCVFCWRHHTNPVSTTFRWKVDEPQVIVDGGIERHVKMITTMRGVPGVSEENLQKAFTVRHCALSLVGEPIMYPRINEFLHLLHNRPSPISSFMVTNAQFPEQLQMLRPVTQLYLSIDAPTPEELKRIDRPLFEDYWDRCLRCVDVLRKKRNTRTVFRLTLVNELNSTNIANYADLVEQGWPDFIEVKGVTFCGTSHTNTINMKTNVPRHDEVISFCAALCEEIARRRPNYVTRSMNEAAEAEAAAGVDGAKAKAGDTESGEGATRVIIPAEERNRPYHIACEHEHSCCVLIALDKFYFNARWNTWIDYAKFFSLAAQYEAANGPPPVLDHLSTENSNNGGHGEAAAVSQEEQEEKFSFTAMDYCAPTPSWAVYRSAERGFDPEQTRVIRKNARPVGPS